MYSKHKIHSLENRLRHYPSRTLQVFNTTHLTRILRKHILETHADHGRKEFSCDQWILNLLVMQIQKFHHVRDFLRQLEQNHWWQLICGFQGNVPTQGQYSRKIPDPRIQDVLIRTFQTYQRLIPLQRQKLPFIPSSAQLEVLEKEYYPFRLDCTEFELSPARYPYATIGYVATEKQVRPSARIHVVQEGIHGVIANYGPSQGHEHESLVADILLQETDEINAWLRDHQIQRQFRPFLTLDRGYWKQARFRELDRRDWGWSIPWKKNQFIGAQSEMLDFPVTEEIPLKILVWAPKSDRPWRRIIGKSDPLNNQVWDVLTNDSTLRATTVLQLQKERWEIEQLFQWLKQQTPIKHPLGTTWMHFVTHCLLVTLLQILLVYFLLVLGIPRWQSQLTRLIKDLRYSDLEPWPDDYFLGEMRF
jgi:hypothetical protein